MSPAHTAFGFWAPTYELSILQPLLFDPVHHTVLDLVHEHAPRAARALDVGCGTGRLLGTARETFLVAIGVDSSAEMVATAKCLRDGPFVCALAERLPFRSGAFEVVTATLSLRHWHDPASGVRELARVLSPGGVLVVADADLEEEARLRKRWHPGRPRGRQLASLLARSGLDVIDYRLAPVQAPIPSIHALAARSRQ